MANLERIMTERHWSDVIAKRVLKDFPHRGDYVCAGGITPSGVVHIGNFRDLATPLFVSEALKDAGKKGRLVFFWDDFDRLRKIPAGIPQEFSKYIGMPISEVPDPYGCHNSYASHFRADLEEVLPQFGIKPEIVSQAAEYAKNVYYPWIKTAMQKRVEIAKIIAKFKTQGMTKEEIEGYYPLQPYCSKCRKDTTTITSYDGEDEVSYECECGHEETADISKRNIGKLVWKVDWPMRWAARKVSFESGGVDHSTEGSSFSVAQELVRDIFGGEPPTYQGYEFVGIKGVTKMSSSTGTGITPKKLLEIYEPEMLKWLFAGTRPKSPITLHFDTDLIRQYEEFDRLVEAYNSGKISDENRRTLELSSTGKPFQANRPGFRMTAALAQVAQGDTELVGKMFERAGYHYTKSELEGRVRKSMAWVEQHVPEMKIKLRESPNLSFYESLSEDERNQIVELRNKIDSASDINSITELVYEIPKVPGISEEEKKARQRAFFRNVYRMLIDRDIGPRLPTFILALGNKKLKQLLKA